MTLLVASVASPCTSLPKCFPGLQFLSRNLREKGAEGKDYTLHLRLHLFLHPVAQAISLRKVGCKSQSKQESPWKKHQNGRERPHFFGFQPPKKCVGSLPPCTLVACHFFGAGIGGTSKPHSLFIKACMQERRRKMSILKAPPQQPKNVALQLRVSEQVKARLAQYVEFLK